MESICKCCRKNINDFALGLALDNELTKELRHKYFEELEMKLLDK